jgi:hypothetical protein
MQPPPGFDACGQVFVTSQTFCRIDLFSFRVAGGAIIDAGQFRVNPA